MRGSWRTSSADAVREAWEKKEKKEDRNDLKRSGSSDLFQCHIMVLNDSNDISREALKYESS